MKQWQTRQKPRAFLLVPSRRPEPGVKAEGRAKQQGGEEGARSLEPEPSRVMRFGKRFECREPSSTRMLANNALTERLLDSAA